MSLVHLRPVTIEWGDCDAAGIVFYPRYFAMFDWSTASLFSHALGMRKPDWIRHYGIVGIPMVDTRGRFIVPSSFGDEVVIESRVAKFGRSSFDIYHRLLKPDGAGGEVLGAECWETRVWVGRHPDDPARMKGMAIPPEVMARLG
ncbi:MAG: acyl-CoA thioesterase [Rhodospirillales bacterium]|nr:acyl-CoA thioesterase [Rhodospirillales bacterium]MDE2574087.1 acyl-CoA thioesterase [Rhodospirillales bacterium]